LEIHQELLKRQESALKTARSIGLPVEVLCPNGAMFHPPTSNPSSTNLATNSQLLCSSPHALLKTHARQIVRNTQLGEVLHWGVRPTIERIGKSRTQKTKASNMEKIMSHNVPEGMRASRASERSFGRGYGCLPACLQHANAMQW